mmetsp:Transcript_36602/g.59191  ORF Transcript_36602/g.59191 Transcript_36602/m.59191 type:complete len:227 (+) Transcript_36602:489-1169(+)
MGRDCARAGHRLIALYEWTGSRRLETTYSYADTGLRRRRCSPRTLPPRNRNRPSYTLPIPSRQRSEQSHNDPPHLPLLLPFRTNHPLALSPRLLSRHSPDGNPTRLRLSPPTALLDSRLSVPSSAASYATNPVNIRSAAASTNTADSRTTYPGTKEIGVGGFGPRQCRIVGRVRLRDEQRERHSGFLLRGVVDICRRKAKPYNAWSFGFRATPSPLRKQRPRLHLP